MEAFEENDVRTFREKVPNFQLCFKGGIQRDTHGGLSVSPGSVTVVFGAPSVRCLFGQATPRRKMSTDDNTESFASLQ